VHTTPALNVLVAAVSTSVADVVPEFDAAAVNVVELQPLALGVASEAIVKVGSTIDTVSDAISVTLSANVNAIDVAAEVTGVAIVNELAAQSGRSWHSHRGSRMCQVGVCTEHSTMASLLDLTD
jgi:hypothetical protein